MEALFKFYGTDWIGMIFGLLSAYYFAKQKSIGFLFAAIAGIGWILFGALTFSIPSIIANGMFIFINCCGFTRARSSANGSLKTE